MKRLLAGLAVAAAVVVPAAPAAADPVVQMCGFTPPLPCGVCVTDEWGYCVWF